jgi:succinyl-diaminopimelate desuccinylase
VIDLKQVIKDTQDLIRIDSQNPGIQEAACGEWVGNRLSDMGLAVKSEVVEGNRKNYIASVPGEGDGPRLVLLAHIDTVPIGGGWTVDPLGGEIINDRIYGRGACDMKGGVAVSLGLVEALVKQKRGMRGDLVFVATVDEEAPDMAGSQALVKDGFFRADDQVLALEPSGTRLRIAQMGLRWLQVNVKGRMAHAGRAHLGIDSAHVMSRIVDRLKGHIASLPHEDEILGKARFTCGTFNSGVATNVVPPSAEAYFDVRIVPPMKIEDVIPMVSGIAQEVIADFPGAEFSVNPLGAPRPPVRADDSSPIVAGLRSAYLKEVGNDLPQGGADGHEAYTDSSMVAALTGSKSCTVFGPGSTDVAHTADEYVPIADLDLVSRVMWRLSQDW